MNLRLHFYRCCQQDWESGEILSMIESLRGLEIRIAAGCSAKLRSIILATFYRQGWSSKVKLSHASDISITATNGKIGLCLQTGNMGRFYADLLKLQYLFQKNIICSAVYIIPTKHTAKIMGSNLANFERMTEELRLFNDIITI